jgi:hypothetical protein
MTYFDSKEPERKKTMVAKTTKSQMEGRERDYCDGPCPEVESKRLV